MSICLFIILILLLDQFNNFTATRKHVMTVLNVHVCICVCIYNEYFYGAINWSKVTVKIFIK